MVCVCGYPIYVYLDGHFTLHLLFHFSVIITTAILELDLIQPEPEPEPEPETFILEPLIIQISIDQYTAVTTAQGGKLDRFRKAPTNPRMFPKNKTKNSID